LDESGSLAGAQLADVPSPSTPSVSPLLYEADNAC
jgi:hypothetical protein